MEEAVAMMPEGYVGTKFRTLFVHRHPPQAPLLAVLVTWAHRLAERGVLATAMGNLSARNSGGFLITPTGTDPSALTPEQFVEVLGVDAGNRTVTAAGRREPSSECLLHAGIYAARPEVGAVFHGHSSALLAAAERLGIPVTQREAPYGTPEMMTEALGILGAHDFVILRNHGFVSLGRTADEAGLRVEQMLGKS